MKNDLIIASVMMQSGDMERAWFGFHCFIHNLHPLHTHRNPRFNKQILTFLGCIVLCRLNGCLLFNCCLLFNVLLFIVALFKVNNLIRHYSWRHCRHYYKAGKVIKFITMFIVQKAAIFLMGSFWSSLSLEQRREKKLFGTMSKYESLIVCSGSKHSFNASNCWG